MTPELLVPLIPLILISMTEKTPISWPFWAEYRRMPHEVWGGAQTDPPELSYNSNIVLVLGHLKGIRGIKGIRGTAITGVGL